MLGDISQRRVCYDGDLLYVPLVISNKLEVADHRAKTLPARERWRIDDDACEIAGCLDLWIDRFREFDEVVFIESRLRAHDHNGMRGVQVVVNHVSLSS